MGLYVEFDRNRDRTVARMGEYRVVEERDDQVVVFDGLSPLVVASRDVRGVWEVLGHPGGYDSFRVLPPPEVVRLELDELR